MTTNRPRTEESKEELVPVAERFNAYDIELYRWASEHFEQTLAEQDADFALDLAALRTAVSGGPPTDEVPAADELSRERLWEELVSARADLLGWEYELAKSSDPSESPPDEQEVDLRGLLKQTNESVLQLHDRIDGLETRLGAGSAHGDADELAQTEEEGRPRRRERERGSTRLEHLREQIEELEKSVGDQPENARDVHVVRELERLRALASEVEEQAHRPQRRAAQADDGVSKAERRQTPYQKAARIESLTKTRDNNATVLARAEERLAEIRGQIQELEAAGPDGNGATSGEGGDSPRTPRLERLRNLAAERERRFERLQKRSADLERRLSELSTEAGTSDEPVA
jgi:hypothetical protein